MLDYRGAREISTVLIRGARQLLTLRGPAEPRRGAALGELAVIHDGSLLIHDGVLQEVGPTRRVENLSLARNAIELNAAGRVVMPGFVDSHTHLLFPLPGLDEPSPIAGAQSIRAVAGSRLAVKARMHLEAMARHGSTTVEVKSGSGPDAIAEIKILRALAALKSRPVDVVPTFLLRLPPSGIGPAGHWSAIESWIGDEFLPKLQRRKLARFADLCSPDQPGLAAIWSRYAEQVEHARLALKVHADGPAPGALVALAAQYGAASVDHLEYATAADASALGRSAAIATLLPCASFHRDTRYAPARSLIEAGAAVALATNFNSSLTPTLNMQAAVKLACCRMGMTPAEAISAATINGAHALGCGGRVGSLEPGKSGDVLVLNISDYRELAHHFGDNLVHTTIKRGEIIWEDGKVAPRPAEALRSSW
jgi:imidazolonepropionase